jgi:serine/threonine protein kinase
VVRNNAECQNGNANSPPYSPLANDIWSLAILLLNLLTARNPWAKASPTDPTFSAYLNGPSNFLPQVLPISSGLNSVLVRALDVQWERREAFGVKGLADGVARLCVDKEDYTKRRSVAYRHKGMGMYSPDVVFEGGMARCPWEVGMHIPSGSSGNDEDDVPIHARVEQPPKPEPKPKVHQREKVVAAYNSVDATLVEIPRSQPSKPKKAHEVSPLIGEYSRC